MRGESGRGEGREGGGGDRGKAEGEGERKSAEEGAKRIVLEPRSERKCG